MPALNMSGIFQVSSVSTVQPFKARENDPITLWLCNHIVERLKDIEEQASCLPFSTQLMLQ